MLTYFLAVCLVSVAVCNEMVQIGNQMFYLTPLPGYNAVTNVRPQNQLSTDFVQNQETPVPQINIANPNQGGSASCQNADVLLNLLSNLLAMFTQTQNNIDNQSLSKVNSELDAIANNIKAIPLTQQNVEVYNKLKGIEANLLQIKTTHSNGNGDPNMMNKLVLQYDLPNQSKPDCRKAFLKLIGIAQQAYSQLMEHPTCKGNVNNDTPFVLDDRYTNLLPIAQTLPYSLDANNVVNPGVIVTPNNVILNSKIPAGNNVPNPVQHLIENVPLPTANNLNGLRESFPSNILELNKGNFMVDPNIVGIPAAPKAFTVAYVNGPTPAPTTGSFRNLQRVPKLINYKENSYGFPLYNSNLPGLASLNVENPPIHINNLPSTKSAYDIYNPNVLQSPQANLKSLQFPNNIVPPQNYPANNVPTLLEVLSSNQHNTNFIPITNSPENNKPLQMNQLDYPKLVLNQVNNYQNPSSNGLELIGQSGSQPVYQYLPNGLTEPNAANIYVNQQIQPNNLQDKSFGLILSGKQNMNEDLTKQFHDNAQFVNHKVNYELPNTELMAGMTNPFKLDSVADSNGLIEVTYLLKRPATVQYQQYYVVKYKLPYNSFLDQVKSLNEHPQFRSNPENLYKETIPISNISEVSQDLKDYNETYINNLVARSGTFLKASIVNNNDTFVDEQLNILKKLNSDVNVYDMLHIVDRSLHNANINVGINNILNESDAAIIDLSKTQKTMQALKDDDLTDVINIPHSDYIYKLQTLNENIENTELTKSTRVRKNPVLMNGREIYKELPIVDTSPFTLNLEPIPENKVLLLTNAQSGPSNENAVIQKNILISKSEAQTKQGKVLPVLRMPIQIISQPEQFLDTKKYYAQMVSNSQRNQPNEVQVLQVSTPQDGNSNSGLYLPVQSNVILTEPPTFGKNSGGKEALYLPVLRPNEDQMRSLQEAENKNNAPILLPDQVQTVIPKVVNQPSVQGKQVYRGLIKSFVEP